MTILMFDFKPFLIFLLLVNLSVGFAQNQTRLDSLRTNLESLAETNAELNQKFDTEINVSNVSLDNLLMAVSEIHDININIDRSISNIIVTNNFNDVNIIDLFIFLCKEHNLTIDITGNILSFKAYQKPIVKPEEIFLVEYLEGNQINLDIQDQALYKVVKKIAEKSGRNIVFKPGLENKKINIYTNNTPFEVAIEQLSLANGLAYEISDNDFIIIKNKTEGNNLTYDANRKNVGYQILDYDSKRLGVNFNGTPIKDIINSLAIDLDLNIFTATPLDDAGNVSFVADDINFDQLLNKIFELSNEVKIDNSNTNPNNQNFNNNNPQNQPTNSKFTFKKEDDIYYFGTESQLSVRQVQFIRLQHRSVELLSDPAGGMNNRRSVGRNNNLGAAAAANSFNNFSNLNNYNAGNNNRNNNSQNFSNNAGRDLGNSNNQSIVDLIPENLTKDLDIKIDYEQNSLYVNGSSQKINRLKNFLDGIDKPVPVVLIEVMIIEVQRSSTVETGISWGLGEEPATTQGNVFPQTNLTLSASTVNRVIGGFDGFGSFNIGKVVPNFFATIKAMESNGNLKIRSTPKLSTLSGHRATFSNGQTSYYTVTQQNIVSGNNPITNEITNFVPIDAELGLTIKPLVSGDGQVTLDIFVIQSNFGQRISENAPPDINSREFSSLIRVQNEDIVVLGGLEEQTKDDSGSGVPFLARIPVIKWLFSERRREDSKAKLTILIKPTIIN